MGACASRAPASSRETTDGVESRDSSATTTTATTTAVDGGDGKARERSDGVPTPRHWDEGDGAARASDADGLPRRVRALEADWEATARRSATERRAHAVMLAEERAVRKRLMEGMSDERRMRGLGAGGRDDATLREIRERGATHTTFGAVLDRRYVTGLVDSTSDAIELKGVRRANSVSPPLCDANDSVDAMSRASFGSAFAASATAMSVSTSVSERLRDEDGGAGDTTPRSPRVTNDFPEDAEVPTRTTPFSDRVERQLQASALKGKRPEEATP